MGPLHLVFEDPNRPIASADGMKNRHQIERDAIPHFLLKISINQLKILVDDLAKECPTLMEWVPKKLRFLSYIS